jgi:acetate kinase
MPHGKGLMSAHSIILALNSGSSSLKFALYGCDGEKAVGRGAIADIGGTAKLSAEGALFVDKVRTLPPVSEVCRTTTDALHALLKWLETCLPPDTLAAVGHRVVHGGDLAQPMLVTPDLLAHLKTLVPLAPLHQPFNLEAIDLIARVHPKVPQVACFDTSFHAGIAPLQRFFAVPRHWHDRGVKRYGFHGLSYEYIAGRLAKISPRASTGRTIVAHLGNGASLCALKDGRSFDMSMGFSALDGLVMGTRPGTLDAGVMLYFLQEAGLGEAAIEHMLYHESGLLGVSGISSDMATLLASKEPAAREAIDLFCLRITREAGGLISLMGGIDAFVFTGGIGEHAAAIRAQIGAALGWTGLVIDVAASTAATGTQETRLSAPQSPIEVWMIPTDEEAVIARHTRSAI